MNSGGDSHTNQHQMDTLLQDNTSILTTIAVTTHLTLLPSMPPDNDEGHSSAPVSARASRGSNVNLAEFLDPSDLSDLDPEIQKTLLGSSDLSELQISHV